MADNRFKNFPIDARFPSPGSDVRFATPGVDARFLDGVDTRFEGETYGSISPITGTAPVLGALSDGDTLSTAVTWGSYTSSAGTITGTVQEMSVNGAAFVAYAGATVVDAGDTYQLRETVTDSAANERVFTSGTVTVAAIAPAQMTAPTLTGGTESATLTLAAAPDDGGSAITSYGYQVDLAAGDFSAPVAVGTQTPASLGNSIDISPLTAADYKARSRAINAVGNGEWSAASATVTIEAVAPSGVIVEFGTDNGVGTGAAPIAAADGTYGPFTVSGGIITPNAPLTAGDYSIGGVTARVSENMFAAASDAEVLAIEPWTLSTALRPDYRVLLRAGVVLSESTGDTFGGGFPRPNPLTLYGRVTLEGEVVDGVPAAEIVKFSPRDVIGNTGDAGLTLKNIFSQAQSADDEVAFFPIENLGNTRVIIDGLHFYGNEYDPYGDYVAKLDYSGLTGTFTVGEKLASDELTTTAQQRSILEVRDNGDGTGTLVLNDGTTGGQLPNTLRDINIGSALSGVTSGATATAVTSGYSTIPKNPRVINVSGLPSCRVLEVRNCVLKDATNAITVRATDDIIVEENTIDRYASDAITVLVGLPDDGKNPTLTVRRNTVTNPINRATDLGNPHCDALQVVRVEGRLFDWIGALIEFNIFWDGDSRGSAQGIFLQQAAETTWDNLVIRANVMSAWGQVSQITSVGDGAHVYNNSVVRQTDAFGSFRAGELSPSLNVNTTNLYEFNLAYAASQQPVALDNANLFAFVAGVATATNQSQIFAGKAVGEPLHITNLAELAEAAAPGISADPRAGAFGSVVDWDTYTITTAHLADPPILTFPVDAADGHDSSTGSVTTDNGTGVLYWVVTTSATTPTKAQVKSGLDASGVAAAANGSQSVTAFGAQTISPAPSGLTASTAYTTHFMHESFAGSQSDVASAAGFTTAAISGHVQNFVDTNATAYYLASNTTLPNSAQLTFYARLKPQLVSGTNMLLESSGRCQISILGSELRVFIRDSLNQIVYDATTNSAVFVLNEEYRVYVAVDLSVPSVSILINGGAPSLSVTTPLIAGSGLIGLARSLGLLANSTGAFITDAHISDYYISAGEIIAETAFHNLGAAKSLSGVGVPELRFGDDMTADERAGNTAQGWNDSYNHGSAVVTTASATFTDVL